MPDFNLRQIVRDVLATSTLADPSDLAAEVSRRIADEDVRTALDQALRQVVREEITRSRMRHAVPESPDPDPSRSARPAPELAPVIPPSPSTSPASPVRAAGAAREHPASVAAMLHARAEVPRVKPGRSVKVAQIRNAALTGRLNDRVHVGGSRWQRLGDCSFEDLVFAAAERRDHSVRNAARAEEFARLADAVRAAGVKRVRDLPAEQLAAVVGGAAA